METCPCGSELARADCCQPVIDGTRAPETAEETMRSRYTAYVTGAVDYIVESNHPDTREDLDRDEIQRWSAGSDWLGLKIVETEAGSGDDDEGMVRFRVRYRMDGNLHVHRERARFERDAEGAWKFHSAEQDSDEEELELVPVVPRAEQVGRNDPCPCGSGKKYKKCHGAAA